MPPWWLLSSKPVVCDVLKVRRISLAVVRDVVQGRPVVHLRHGRVEMRQKILKGWAAAADRRSGSVEARG